METNLLSPIGKLRNAFARRLRILANGGLAHALKANSDGFTLIEVLVALAILGVSLATLLGIFSQSLEYTRETRIETQARTLAQSLLAQSGEETSLHSGTISGTAPPNLSWRVIVRPYDREAQNSWSVAAVTVTAFVEWIENGQEKSLSLDTLRLTSKAPAS